MKLKIIIVAIVAAALTIPTFASGWCKICYTPVDCNTPAQPEVFCGSYDNDSPQGCWTYNRKPKACPTDPSNPNQTTGVVTTTWQLASTCTNDDCL